MVVHTPNTPYSGDENRRILFQGQSRQKLVSPYLKKNQTICGIEHQ
jgi:hypothetical protein